MEVQTLIEELRLEIIKHLPNNPDAVFDIMSKANKVTKAKVLESLEREVPKAFQEGIDAVEDKNPSETIVSQFPIDYIETEVKPKYK